LIRAKPDLICLFRPPPIQLRLKQRPSPPVSKENPQQNPGRQSCRPIPAPHDIELF
jgi:hypothetical protein